MGNSYRLLHGDAKKASIMLKEANSRPINLSDDIVPRVIPFLYKTIQQYGKNSFTWVGPIPRVNIMKPELIREVFLEAGRFQKQKPNPLANFLLTGLVSYEGKKWAKHRKLLNPAFHAEKLKLMSPAFHLSCRQMISKMEEMVSPEGSCELDVWPFLKNLTADALSRTSFGSSYEEGRRLFQLLQEQTYLTMEVFQSVYIPGWWYLPTKRNKRMKKIDKEMNTLLNDIITKRDKAMKDGKTANEDLLGILMESNSKEIQEGGNSKNAGISMQEVVEECKLFYLAGQETTSNLLLWTMVLLSKHPNWQTLAREEVFQVFGKNKPEFAGLSHLKVVTMIFYEVLRLYPPGATLNRAVYEDINLGELYLPSGVEIVLPTILVHHDPEIWGDDVKEFKPERFSEGVMKATKGQLSYFPFGWGPRICIGQNFAMAEAKMALAMILQCFTFELSPSYTHAPTSVLTLQPQYGAHLIFHKI
ncbi:cytochrome P450 CYP72A219-like isoform X2 [Vitis riparia]|uniref:cytochrome P450 CYP72A219-like isoform X2 n=1 Tax=Vitis riparia TaxID=96939 RepID=UPI00155A97A3|nr:cytochrome P450 CYP72A219-like isoform X2 [Vitis riparia]